ncbi:MAG: hypothetical protein HQM04_11725 [Magnetococcales bacterium]|nr:hypothetical protein [Magnetococcales bacterium]MBF0115694.1 hypothetical protein [Magnetococcales bacterium]
MSDPNLIERLNGIFYTFLGEVILLAVTHQAPVLQQDRAVPTYHPAPVDWPEPPINEYHALIKDYLYPAPCLTYQETDYKGIVWLRQQQRLAEKRADYRKGLYLLGAALLPYAAESAEMVFHQRSPLSATFPDALHIIGGATSPRRNEGMVLDRSLRDTAMREAREEAGLPIFIPETSATAIGIEFRSGFFHATFLQTPVSTQALDAMQSTWEGQLLRVPFQQFDQLVLGQGAFQNVRWVPSGMLHLLVWLAWSGVDPALRFGSNNQSAPELLASLLDHLERQILQQPEALRARFAAATLPFSSVTSSEDALS